jgi:ribosomal protein L23
MKVVITDSFIMNLLVAVKVADIRTVNTPLNKKKAYIKIAKGFKASDVATKLKLV